MFSTTILNSNLVQKKCDDSPAVREATMIDEQMVMANALSVMTTLINRPTPYTPQRLSVAYTLATNSPYRPTRIL